MSSTAQEILAELETRAGQSDTDREAWLAERRSGITATNVRDLACKGPSRRAQIVAEKRGEYNDTFNGNQYTEWGNRREPIIAAWVREQYGIEPETRVFKSKNNPAYLASPDGIGVIDGELVLAEIKTAGKHVWPGNRLFKQSGYALQMQWQMYVLDAARCLYVLEEHDNEWKETGGDYKQPTPPDEPLTIWIERDDAVIAELIKVADDALALIRDGIAEPTEEVAAEAHRYASAVSQRDNAKAQLALLNATVAEHGDRLRQLLPPGEFTEGPFGRIAIGAAYESTRMDNKSLADAYPEIAAQFRSTISMPGRITYTPTTKKAVKR